MMVTKRKRTNKDRCQWLEGDGHLYVWWKSTKLSKMSFVRRYKEQIDSTIDNLEQGRKMQHDVVLLDEIKKSMEK